VKSFGGGCVESVVTFDTQRFFLESAIRTPRVKHKAFRCTGASMVAAYELHPDLSGFTEIAALRVRWISFQV
jgi:hypothetical protein